MTWVVEVLDDRVREELDVLPDDMKARLRRIVELIQGYGLERVHEPHIKHLQGALGDAYEGAGWDFPRKLCDCERSSRRGCQGVCKENTEDAAAGA